MPPNSIPRSSCLICIDVQNDFCPGGALPVKNGDKIIAPLNRYIKIFSGKKLLIVATRDWHPPNHISFKKYGGVWPRHCVQKTKGSEFHPSLNLPEDSIIISKGYDPQKEAYSGFQGADKEGKSLIRILKSKGIKNVFVGGLATDYCVKATALDALKAGFQVYFLEDASKGVNVKPGDIERAMKEMQKKGIKSTNLGNLK